MAVEALCPTCGAAFSVKDEYLGKKVRCKKCEHVFTVGGDKIKKRDEDDAVRAGAAPPGRSSRDDDDEDRPRKRAARAARDDDEDDDDRGGRRRKRVYHDDADDDDDRPRRARRQESSGGSGKIIAIIATAVVVLFLVCGGAIYGIYRWTQQAANDMANADQQVADAFQQAMNEAAKQNPNFPGFDRQPKDLDEAMTFLKGNVAAERRGAARWLASQPIDNGRRKDVAAALEPLLKDDDASCGAAAAALKTWGTRDNGPALTAALKTKPDNGIPGETPKELMAAIGHVKYEPGADEILRFLSNAFANEDASRALAELGPGAQNSVLKRMHDKNNDVRNRARRLLDGYKTPPGLLLDQTVEDLGSVEQERSKSAVEWLAQPASTPALEQVKNDTARRATVAKALNRLIDSPPKFSEDTLLLAVKRWGTRDNVPSLVNMLTTNPFKKREVADALIAIGPACEPDVKPLLAHKDARVVEESKRILSSIGVTDVKYVAAIEDLKSGDNRRVEQAARVLQAGAVDEKQRPAVVAALLGTIKGTGVRLGDHPLEDVAKALALWMTRDDGAQAVEKVKEMDKFFCKKSRKILIEWLGKQKVEAAVPLLAGLLLEREYAEDAGRALQAMGPQIGEKFEAEVPRLTFQPNDRPQLLECIKVLGAVGTKKGSVPILNRQRVAAQAKKDAALANACDDAVRAINAR